MTCFARPASEGTIFFGTCSHTSGGPRCSSPSPMAICGRPSRKQLVKCSPVIMTMAWTCFSRQTSRTFSSALKKLSACARGAEPGSAVINGACDAEYASRFCHLVLLLGGTAPEFSSSGR